MNKEKIAITLDEKSVDELDRLVRERVFLNRSQAVQAAVSEKLLRLKRTRLAIECGKLEPDFEKALAEDGMDEDAKKWPEY